MSQVPPGHSLLAGRWDWPMLVVSIAVLLGVAALLTIWLGRHHSVKAKLVWTAVVIVIPIFGPLAWFGLGQERR